MMPQLSFWKYKVILLSLFSLSLNSYAFSEKECLDASFSTTITHKGKPFGLFENKIKLSKNSCEISLAAEKYKFIKSNWIVDTCRGPVHIKENSSGSISVIKRVKDCSASPTGDEFCENWKKIKELIQDYGLIFASGEKEDLTSNHGKVYCAYKLLEYYLYDGKILSRNMSFAPAPKAKITVEEGETIKVDAPLPKPTESMIEIKEKEGEF